MNVFDILNFNVRKEIKRKKHENLPSYIVINKQFLKLFPEIKTREKIYEFYSENQSDYNALLEFAKLDDKLANSLLTRNILINNDILKNLKIIKKYGLDDKFVSNNTLIIKVEKYIEEYGEIIVPYLNKNLDDTISFLEIYSKYSGVDLEFALENKNIYIYLKTLPVNKREILKTSIENKNIEEYEKIKVLINEGFDVDIINIFKYYNYDKDIIKIFMDNRIFKKVDLEKCMNNQILEFKIDYAIKKKDIGLLKENILIKFFGSSMTYDTIKKYMDNSLNLKEEYKNYFEKAYELVVEIKNAKTIEELINLYNENSSKFDENLYKKITYNSWKNCLKKLITKDNKLEDKINSNVDIIDGSDITNFNLLIHTIGKKSIGPNASFGNKLGSNPELWENNTEGKSNNISCSLISEYNMFVFTYFDKADVIIGFNDIKNTQILNASNCDAMTNMETGTDFSFDNNILPWDVSSWRLPESILNSALHCKDTVSRSYNEIVLGRNEFGVVKKPDYILCTKNFENSLYVKPIDENSKKWAKYYDIPILQLDGNTLYRQAIENFNKTLEIISKGDISLNIFDELMKSIKTFFFTKGKKIDILEILKQFINKNKENLDDEKISSILKIIEKYGETIIDDMPSKYANSALEEIRVRAEREKELEQLKNDLECKKQIINDNLEEKEYSM